MPKKRSRDETSAAEERSSATLALAYNDVIDLLESNKHDVFNQLSAADRRSLGDMIAATLCQGEGSTGAEETHQFGGQLAEKSSDPLDNGRALMVIKRALHKQVGPFGSIQEHLVTPNPNSVLFGYDGKSSEGAPITVEVDDFLYDDDEVDALCDSGKLDRNYCTACRRTDSVKPVQFISHSFGFDKLKYILNWVLTPEDYKKATSLCDVGSRLGVVLFAAAALTPLQRIIGVEINKQYHDVQMKTLSALQASGRRNKLFADIGKRVTCVHGDALEEHVASTTLQAADIVIFNNVFEWFADNNKQVDIWRKVRSLLIRPGQIIITVPSIADSLKSISFPKAAEFEQQWVKQVELDPTGFDADEGVHDDGSSSADGSCESESPFADIAKYIVI